MIQKEFEELKATAKERLIKSGSLETLEDVHAVEPDEDEESWGLQFQAW